MCDLMQAHASVSIRGRGVIRRGSVLCADDPVVQAHSGSFRPVGLQHYCGEAPVEQMTARPGEKRDVAVYRCDQCDATAKSPAGLAAHKRSHGIDGEQ